MAPRLFFLVGSPRSGTTLLGAMLSANPNIAVTQETHFVPTFWQKRSADGNLADDQAWDRLVGRFIESRAFVDMRMDEARFRDAAQRAPRTHPALFEALVMQFAERERVSLVGEKTPAHALYIPVLERLFPGALYVEIVRDPWATVASLKKVPWSERSVQANAETWRHHVAEVQRVAPRLGDRLFRVTYAELVQSPEAVMRRACQFLGTEYDAAMLDHASHRRWQHRPGVTWIESLKRPVNADSVERWRSELSADEIADIERVCYFEMRRLGLKPLTSPSRLLVPATALAARRGAARVLKRLGRFF
jgi:hypothetical protein